jgi:hypothetical protein
VISNDLSAPGVAFMARGREEPGLLAPERSLQPEMTPETDPRSEKNGFLVKNRLDRPALNRDDGTDGFQQEKSSGDVDY